MKVLVALLLTWLSSNFDLPAKDDHPAVQLVPSEQLVMLRYGAIARANANEPIAVTTIEREQLRRTFRSECTS